MQLYNFVNDGPTLGCCNYVLQQKQKMSNFKYMFLYFLQDNYFRKYTFLSFEYILDTMVQILDTLRTNFGYVAYKFWISLRTHFIALLVAS